jgi:dienelactone hydrolase
MEDPPGPRPVNIRLAFAGLLTALLLSPACSPPAEGPVRKAFLPETNPFAGLPHVAGIGNEGGELLGAAPAEPVRETVRFASNDADLFGGQPTIIEAELYRPVGAGPFPALVALHDCMGLYGPNGKVNSHMRDWAERLSAQGYAVLMPDSLNPRGMPENCDRDPELVRPGVERARDAAASLDWLQAQPWASGDRVGVIGWASGGTTALTFATSDGRLRGRSGQFDFRLIVAFYPNCATLTQAPGWRSDIKLTVFVGGNDNWAPAQDCVALVDRVAQTGGALDLVKYNAAAHDFDWPGMPLHMKAGLTMTASGGALIGTDSQARADAVTRVSHLFADSLHP